MPDVVANYAGQDSQSGKYNVSVKPTNPSGKLGDAGMIQQFDSPEDAKEFITAINNNQNLKQPTQDGFVRTTPPQA